MYQYAITRKPCKHFSKGISTSSLGKPDYQLMLEQHKTYVDTLKSLELKVLELEALNDYPDAHFVEDTAIVTPNIAIITNPGAESRKGEEISIEPVLAKYRIIERIESPGTVDGGDVLMVENHFFIGVSDRTNPQGAEQLGDMLTKYGHSWKMVSVDAGLHLKSSVNCVGNNTLLLTEEFAQQDEFKNYQKILIVKGDEYAGNSLLINDNLIVPAGFPRTRTKLESLGINIIELNMSESQKMDGGLTCLSLRF